MYKIRLYLLFVAGLFTVNMGLEWNEVGIELRYRACANKDVRGVSRES